MHCKFPRRSWASEFEQIQIEKAGEWLIAKEERGELISKSYRYAYRKQLWFSFHKMLKSATLGYDLRPDSRLVELVRLGSQITPLINRPYFKELEADIAKKMIQQEGGGE
jgi:hypothetical protein